MTDIPASILQIATTAVKEISSLMEASPTLGAAATEVIARALMERDERAAKIAENQTRHFWSVIGRTIAAAIRSRTP